MHGQVFKEIGFNYHQKLKFQQGTTGAEVVAALPDSVTVVITGPTPGGLGLQTAVFLAASKPSTILLLGREESKDALAVESVKATSPSTTVRLVYCDLEMYSSIRTAAKTILATTPKIHTLINNAGVIAPANYRTTPEGLEVQFGINHIGHFLLTNLLMLSILAAASEGARIVSLSSSGWSLGEVRFDDYNFTSGKNWNKWKAYGQSKTVNILFTVELARRLEGRDVQAFALHPGLIFTNLEREMDIERDLVSIFEAFNGRGYVKIEDPMPFKTLETGSSTTLVAALDPALKITFFSLTTEPRFNSSNLSTLKQATLVYSSLIAKSFKRLIIPQIQSMRRNGGQQVRKTWGRNLIGEDINLQN
ncbi:hypothetical protein DID88_001057 [Monilinia fructigena]|uniref:Uncharacterized protein n=1 Tax=Monilinia fructigena TaxID=38457 RepID=A0A395IZA5_9HELO|nr:hypothetical protein DID88_001057 [Monilinia fructigena]